MSTAPHGKPALPFDVPNPELSLSHVFTANLTENE